MIVRTTPQLATFGPRLRNAVLALFALLVAHDAIYVAQFGVGDRFALAMAERGHDGYWVPVTLAVVAAAAMVFLAVIGLLMRLERQSSQASKDRSAGPSYLHELATTWLRLFPTVGILFAIQENVEHVLVDGHIIGLGALAGPGSSLVLPVLAAATFVLAALGSLIRWRIRVLEARIAAASRQDYPAISAECQPREWASIAAMVAHLRTLDRRDAGRAPPGALPRISVATA